jgi:hypothetical protein
VSVAEQPPPETGDSHITIHDHARRRMDEMGVHEPEVIDAVRHPELTAPDKEHADRRVAVKGRLRVVYSPEKNRHGVPVPDRQIVVTVMWENGAAGRAAGPTTHVPNKVSNRAFYDRLIIWGCTPGRRRSDYVQMRTPSGQLIEVRHPDGVSKGNTTRTIIDAIKAVGASGAEEFWGRTEKVRPARERVHATPAELAVIRPENGTAEPVVTTPTKPEPSLETVAGRVLAYYRGHPNTVPPKERVAEQLGYSVMAISNACYALVRDGHLEKASPGKYRYRRWGESPAAKQKAQDALRWVTDPANRPPPPKPRGPRGPYRRKTGVNTGITERVFDYYRSRAGEVPPMAAIAELFDVDIKVVNNAVLNLRASGRLQRVRRGEYVYPATNGTPPRPAPATDPLARLDQIQRRLAAETDAEVTDMPDDDSGQPDPIEQLRSIAAGYDATMSEPEPVVDAADQNAARAPQTAASGEHGTAAPSPPVHATIDDEIDAVLDLLVPRLRARHLRLAAEWTEVTHRLLTATRADQ